MQAHSHYKLLDKASLKALLTKRFCEGHKKLSDIPSPTRLIDAQKAAKKIADTIKAGKKITLIGDYDVDGVSATAITVDFFRQIPYPLEAIIPNRFNDGYGVSENVLARVNADLVITVDNGITAVRAAEVCKERGIELIITDHHTPLDVLPEAFAIVDPKLMACEYPFKDICGAQVAWLLLALVKKELALNIDMRSFFDILCIAIIADIMPLIDINRTIVKDGLKQIMHSSRPSSVVIRDFLNKSAISSEDIAFQIAPRINSAGRLEDASMALDFFTATTIEQAYAQFERLNRLNELRKETEAEATKEALEMACEYEHDLILVLACEDWHEGVVGIVASRLTERFGKPAIVLSIEGESAKGSARSIGDVNIHELIKANSDLLTKFGGHKMAAGLGLKVEDIPKFREAINKSAKELDERAFIPHYEVIGILKSSEIDHELLHILDSFEPYGEANERPSFYIDQAHIHEIKYFGQEQSHSKIIIKQFVHDLSSLELILFKERFSMPSNRRLSCSYKITKNEYNGKISAQLLIDKIRKHS